MATPSMPRAMARNTAIFLLGHFLFRGNEVLWVVLAALAGAVAGAGGMWLVRNAHDGPLLDTITRPGGLVRFRGGGRAHAAPRAARRPAQRAPRP